MVLSTQNLHLGNANVNLRFKNGMVSPAYKTYDITGCSIELLAHWIKSDAAKHFFYNATTVGASMCRRNVEWKTLYEQPLFLPSTDEQDKIASFLSFLTQRIDAQQKYVATLKKYKRGLQNRFFFKRSHLSPKASEIDSHDVEPLGSVVHINPKTGSLPEAFIYIDLECVESGVLNSKKLISRNSAPSRAQRLLEEGDLLYQMVRPYQKTITISKRVLNIQQLHLPGMHKSDAQRWTLNSYTSNFRQTILPVKQCFAVQVQGIQLSMQMILRKFPFGFRHLISRRKLVRRYPFSGKR